MTRIRPLLVASLLVPAIAITFDHARAVEIAPGTTSPMLQAEGCATASGQIFGGACTSGCSGSCDLSDNEANSTLDISNFTVGRKFSEASVYTDFTVKASDNGAATSLDATIAYDVAWAGGWTLGGLATGWNDVQSEVTLTLTDKDTGAVVRTSTLHNRDVDGFLGIDIIEVGFGLDQGAAINTMDVHVVRGKAYRLALKVRIEGKGAANAVVLVDYSTGGWGTYWNDLKVTVAADLAEEIEKLKKRVDALEHHTHTYLTGRGEGHNNTEATTSEPILKVEEPSDDERHLLPGEDPNAEPLPVKSVFLASAPNPSNPSTTITYTLPEALRVTIHIFDARGRLVRTLLDADRPKGPNAVAFDGDGFASGVYYFRLTAGRFTETRKLTLLK